MFLKKGKGLEGFLEGGCCVFFVREEDHMFFWEERMLLMGEIILG